MVDRSDFSPLAAIGIWIVSLIGSWAMALALLGSIGRDLVGCGSDPAPSGADGGSAVGWMIVSAGVLVPVLVMVAVAPTDRRLRLTGPAMVTAAVGLVVASIWIGPCL